MSADRDIDGWLAERGITLPEARARAREVLEEAGLTRPGKARMSEPKLERATERMAAMDRLLADIHGGVNALIERARMTREDELRRQVRAAARLASFQYVAVGVLLALVFAVVAQGVRMHRQAVADADERERVLGALRASERRFRSLSAASPVGVFELDPSLACTYVNPRWREATAKASTP